MDNKSYDIIRDSKKIPIRVNQRLKEFGITRKELSEILDLQLNKVRNYLKGKDRNDIPSQAEIINMCKFLGIELRLTVIVLPKEGSTYKQIMQDVKTCDYRDVKRKNTDTQAKKHGL